MVKQVTPSFHNINIKGECSLDKKEKKSIVYCNFFQLNPVEAGCTPKI